MGTALEIIPTNLQRSYIPPVAPGSAPPWTYFPPKFTPWSIPRCWWWVVDCPNPWLVAACKSISWGGKVKYA